MDTVQTHTDAYLSLSKHSHKLLSILGECDHRRGGLITLGILNHFGSLPLHHCYTRVGGPKVNSNYCPLHL